VDVLVALLNHVPSGGCTRRCRNGLASSVFGTERQQREAGFAYFGANLSRDASLETARDALLGVLEGFAKNPVTEDEVELARRRLVNDIELTLADSASSPASFRIRGHRRLARAVPAPRPAEAGHRRRRPGRRDSLSQTRQPHAGDVHSDALARPRGDSAGAGLGRRAQGLPRLGHGALARISIRPREHRGARHPQDASRRHEAPLLPKKTRGGTVVAQLTLQWGDEQSKLNRAAACGMTSGMLMRGTQKNSREQLRNQFDRLKANVGVGGDGARSKPSARPCGSAAADRRGTAPAVFSE